ncbi:hypothetical protein AB0C13_25410 [Streptomyces sp. NPDC049099]|uniref:hypothetical protein n=1 Tax=Streptomyces sp. NPDC049099 TaxID=3155768 RepID=UPI0034442A03
MLQAMAEATETLALEAGPILFGGIGIVFVVFVVVGVYKERDTFGCMAWLVLPAIVACAAILYFGFS